MNETGEFSTLLREGPPSEASGAAFLLSVVEGPDRGAALLVDGSLPSRAYVGTSSSCVLRLSDPEVSRRHLALEAIGQRLRVTDLASRNGTMADGVLVVEAFLRGGELLRLGKTAIGVERRESTEGPKVSPLERFGRVVGASPEMQRLYPLCERLAATDVPVILEGETGTGKEVLAEALHEQGPRAQGPFVVFDCAAVSPTVADSELFGLEGAFDQAHGGTLLFDEIGDLDLPLQSKLLRALDRSDVRVLFATRRDLDRLVEVGWFREDLLQRIAVARLELPPLRRRAGDVRRLALHFARSIGGPAATLPPDLVAQWEADPWPGNVRELRDAVARWLALDDLADELTAPSSTGDLLEDLLAQHLPLVQARDKVVAELESRYAARVLAEHGGSIAQAADASGIARRHFQRARRRR